MSSWALHSLIAGGLLLLALLSVVSHTPRGVAQSMDSLVYLDTAQHLYDGRGLSRTHYALDGPGLEPMTTWPPLYSLSLVPIMWVTQLTGVPVDQLLRLGNGLLLGLSLLIFLGVLRARFSLGNSALLCAVLAAFPSWQIVPVYAWSESLFLPLVLAGYWALDRYLGAPRQPSWLLLCFTALGLATATRYVGLALALAAVIAAISLPMESWRRRVGHLVAGVGVYALLLTPLLLRNWSLSGELSGADRGRPSVDLSDDLALLGSLLEREFWNSPPAAILAAGACVGLVVAFARLREAPRSTAQEEVDANRGLMLPALFLGSYLLFLLVARQVQVIDLDTRMLVVTPPFVVLLLCGVAQRASAWSAGLVSGVVAAVLVVWLSNAYTVHRSLIDNWREQAEPGRVLGIHYPALSSQRFDALRRSSDAIVVESGQLLLTDVPRPAVVAHFFPGADVRQLDANAIALASQRLAQGRGVALLMQPQVVQILASVWGDSAQVLRIDGSPNSQDLYVLRTQAPPSTGPAVQ